MRSEIPENQTAFFLKFVKPEFEQDFINGRLYMNPLKRFIDMEKQSGVRGMGDALEASAVYVDVDLTIKHPVTDEVLLTGKVGKVNFYSNSRVQSPVLCLYSVDKEVLKIDSEDETYLKTVPTIEDSDLQKLISDFGDNMIIINAAEFTKRVINKCKVDNIDFRMGKVKYHDFSKNYSDRTKLYYDLESSDVCFIKDDYFKAQNEYRILLENISAEGFYILDVGDLSDIIRKFKISDFFGGNFRIDFKKSSLNI